MCKISSKKKVRVTENNAHVKYTVEPVPRFRNQNLKKMIPHVVIGLTYNRYILKYLSTDNIQNFYLNEFRIFPKYYTI